MKVATMTMRALLMLASLTVGSAGVAIAADEAKPTEAAKPAEPVPAEKPKIDVRRLFATNWGPAGHMGLVIVISMATSQPSGLSVIWTS